jgi:hypothetical protein
LVYTGFYFIQGSVYTGFYFIQGSVYTGFYFIQGSVYTGFYFIQGSVYTGFTVHVLMFHKGLIHNNEVNMKCWIRNLSGIYYI